MAAPAAASSLSFARPGSWGSVSPDEGVRFRTRGGLDALPGHVGNPSGVANLATMTWLDVVTSHLCHHPKDRDAVWYILGGKVVGTDIPLSQPLHVTLRSGQVVDVHIPVPGRAGSRPSDEHEKIKYALAAYRCGRAWPAWDKDDVDIVNQAVLGGWDERREGDTSNIIADDQNNSIGHLVGLRTATGLVVYLNIHVAMKALDGALQALDPEVRPLEVNEFAEPLTRASLGSISQRYHKLSPAQFLLDLYKVIIEGFPMVSEDDRAIDATTHTLPIIDVAAMVAMVQRIMGPSSRFTAMTPPLRVIPEFFDECVDIRFGRALATVEIECQNIEASPTGKHALNSAEYEAALANAESMLEDFLFKENQAIADGWGEDEDGWNEFLEEIRGPLPDDEADKLVEHITKRKKEVNKNKRARTKGRPFFRRS